MSVKTKPFNPFEYFESAEEVNDYLLACLNDEDPNLFVHALGQLAKHHGMSRVAQATGLNRESLYKTFSGKVQPKWSTIVKVMRALGVELKVAA